MEDVGIPSIDVVGPEFGEGVGPVLGDDDELEVGDGFGPECDMICGPCLVKSVDVKWGKTSGAWLQGMDIGPDLADNSGREWNTEPVPLSGDVVPTSDMTWTDELGL